MKITRAPRTLLDPGFRPSTSHRSANQYHQHHPISHLGSNDLVQGLPTLVLLLRLRTVMDPESVVTFSRSVVVFAVVLLAACASKLCDPCGQSLLPPSVVMATALMLTTMVGFAAGSLYSYAHKPPASTASAYAWTPEPTPAPPPAPTPAPPPAATSRTMAVQSQCTYKYWWAKPEFKPLPGVSHGAYEV